MFLLHRIPSNARSLVPVVRHMSSASPLVDVAIDNEGIATLSMQRLPVNSLNLELIQAIKKSIEDVEKDKARAIILASNSATVFSAGIDINEMYKPDLKRAEEFWTTLQDCWMKYYGTPLITAAAISGHSPAGGCLLSLSSEYRAMVGGKYAIGLNETALGIVAPFWFQEPMLTTIGRRQGELALTTGRMFSTEEAYKVGLIDDIATDKADTIAKCRAFIKKFDRIPAEARSYTKKIIRNDLIELLIKNRKADTNQFLTFLKNPKVQQNLEMYMNSLKKKATK